LCLHNPVDVVVSGAQLVTWQQDTSSGFENDNVWSVPGCVGAGYTCRIERAVTPRQFSITWLYKGSLEGKWQGHSSYCCWWIAMMNLLIWVFHKKTHILRIWWFFIDCSLVHLAHISYIHTSWLHCSCLQWVLLWSSFPLFCYLIFCEMAFLLMYWSMLDWSHNCNRDLGMC